MIDEKNYLKLKDKYGHVASWAVWKQPGITPKSNTEDLSMFDDIKIIESINTKYVFVGLNAAANHGNNNAEHRWQSFHSGYCRQNDFKLRYALTDTKYWGSYITDIIKEYEETDSTKVISLVKKDPAIIDKNIALIEDEFSLLGIKSPVLIAMGNATYSILIKYLSHKYKIYKIPHYAHRISKEKYREAVRKVLESID